jgi:hypothetical protein
VYWSQGPPPDPTHIPFTLPADIPWKGPHGGEYTATLFGDPSKPGPYGFLAKWMPGNFSRPHFHSVDRWICVVSGAWWVSSSSDFDLAKAYPLQAGTFAIDRANTVHWDGVKAGGEPAVLELVGRARSRAPGSVKTATPCPQRSSGGAFKAPPASPFPFSFTYHDVRTLSVWEMIGREPSRVGLLRLSAHLGKLPLG